MDHQSTDHHSPPKPIAQSAGPAGLLVVTVDCLPAWMLAPYGATWVATPALDALAARGVVFDRVITPSLDPGDTLRELFAAAVPDDRPFFTAAEAAGWRPAVVTDDPALAARMAAVTSAQTGGCLRLVEAVAKETVEEDDAQTNIARLVDAAIEVIAAGEHRLVWCHVGSLGVAWDAPESYRDRYVDPDDPSPPSGARVPGFAVDADTDPDLVVGLRHVFAGQVTLLDSQLGRLFAAVQEGKAAAAGPWAVAIVGVRGLPLGLHGWIGLGGQAVPYGELAHVPAILVDAAGRMKAQRYGGLVVPADLGATLVDVVSRAAGAEPQASAIDPAAPWRGTSLAGLFENWSVSGRPRGGAGGAGGPARVTPAWHGLLAAEAADALTKPAAQGRVRLFAKPDDFFELADVANRCADVAARLETLLEQAHAGECHAVWRATLSQATTGSSPC
jgi:hypothetical protein